MKADGLEVTYLRLKRSIQASEETGLRFFDSNEACAEALKEIKGNILLTTGSKELSAYTASEEVKNVFTSGYCRGWKVLKSAGEKEFCHNRFWHCRDLFPKN